jgi:uncharacterized FlaG/YvyC family protein
MSLALSGNVSAAAVVTAATVDGGQQRPAPAPPRQPPPEVATAVQLDAYLREHNQSIRFLVDARTGMTIVNIYNETTGEIVQQIPNEVVVRIAQYLKSRASAGATSLNVSA